MKDGQELQNLINQNTGCEQPYVHSLVKSFFYTPGVRDFARNAGIRGRGAYWLLDIMATEPKVISLVKREGFALVIVKVEGSKARVTAAADSDVAPEFVKDIDYTDCPEAPGGDGWKFYLEPTQVGQTTGIMMMCPKER